MARKEKAPKAPKTPKENKPATPMSSEIKSGIAIALAIIIVFTAGNIVGSVVSKNNVQEIVTVPQNEQTQARPIDPTVAPTTVAPATTAAPVATDAPTAAPDTTAAPADAPTQAPADTTAAPTDAPAAPSGAPQTTAEIVAYFNTAANKIKSEGTSIVRNYEDLQHNEEKLVVPGPLQAIGSGLISSFLKKDETPVTYEGADMVAEFPIKGENVVSKTTEADLKSATCVDEGSTYKITLTYIDTTDPTDTGAANAFNIMKAEDIYSAASIVKNFSARYYDAVIECTVDKASGHITWINYKLPIVLNVTAQVVVSLDAQVGMTFIDDYTINY